MADTGNFTVHVLLSRALFDHQDHEARTQAIRETWGKDPQVRLHVLDFGVKNFEVQFRNWCTDRPHCKIHYGFTPGETEVPKDVLTQSSVWNLDGHVWAMRRALADTTCQWIMVGQDMLYVQTANLKAYLAKFDPKTPVVLSNRLHGHLGIMGSPWGYFMSRSAAQGLVDGWENGLRQQVLKGDPFLQKLGGMTDFGLGYALHRMKSPAEFVDTRTEKGIDRLYLWPPSRMERGDWWDSWYPNMRKDNPKKALDPEAFLFFFAGPKEIRALGAFFEHRDTVDSFLESSKHRESRSFYKESTWRMLDRVRAEAAKHK